MLKNPPASDWLVLRGNYQGWSYSSLNQINRNNVQHLQLVWQWAMNDSGTNETSPIVHNGVLYLASPSHIVQALDARTGDLIWETRAGPYQAPGGSGSPIRSIGIMGDKILLPANNAHAVAINARNGEIVWKHRRAAAVALERATQSGPQHDGARDRDPSADGMYNG